MGVKLLKIMRKLKRFKLLLFFNLFVLVVFAQANETYTIKGRITDVDGAGLPGVTVSLKNDVATGATISDIDGNYSIKAKKLDYIVFNCIGFQQQQIQVLSDKKINIVLKENDNQLDEVVISVPYGIAKKSTFTGSASLIDSKIIASSQVSSVSKALQGSVAGLQSYSTSGQPGEDASVYIRGVGSVNASTSPLYVVDGVPYDGKLSSISSQDIASVTVLKDAAAAALYGSRAANGVVMITTKQGSNNSAPSIEFSAKYGFSSRAVKDYNQLNTNDYFTLQWEAVRNSYLDKKLSSEDAAQRASSELFNYIGINPYGTKYPQPIGTDGKLISGINPLWNDSWEDALTQSAHYTDLSARISGGGENMKYFFSLGYLDDQGAYIYSGFKRYTLRSSITSDIKKWLQIGLNVSGTHSIQNYPKQNDTAIGNIVLAARSIPSFYPIYERDLATGQYLLNDDGQRIYDYGNYRKSSYNGYNFVQTMDYDKHEIKRDAASVRGFVLISPLEGLSYKMSLNVDYDSRFSHDYVNPTYGKEPLTGSVDKRNDKTTGVTINNVVNWARTLNSLHSLSLMAGQEYYEYNTTNFYGSRSGPISDGFFEPGAAATVTGFNGKSEQYKLLSFFGNATYSFDQKYFLSGSVRSDGSSRFHPDNRWGTFWSLGGSWKINQESFLASSRNWLSNLSLRASYGAQGNDNILVKNTGDNEYYPYQGLYDIGSFLGQSTLHASRLEAPDLKWETNLNFNLGLDFGFFNNRLNGTVEYFVRSSKDLLFERDLTPSTGFSSIYANIGKLKNYGWEFTVNGTPIYTKDWNWRLSVNATTYKNEIVKLPTSPMWQSSKKWVEGGSLYDFWLYEWAGVNPENGNAQWYFYDKNGDKQKTENYDILTSDDKVKVGSSLPKLTGGFQSDLTWKDISVSVLFSYGIGGKIYNNDKVQLMRVNGGTGNTMSEDIINRWTPENTNTSIPRLVQDGTSKFTSSSSYWLVDRSYLRLKTFTLSYSIPKKWISYATLKDVNIFVQGENMLTFTKQQGLDPEQPISGMASFRYPAMKTISFGINVKL